MSRKIKVGGVQIGGGAGVSVQSMTNTNTADWEATLRQIEELRAAGCDIVRCAVPDMDSVRGLGRIRERTDMPIVADIHFDYRLAVEAAAAGADKIRINPGNIGSDDRVKAVVAACRAREIPIRIGVNGGSLPKDILERYGVTGEGMVAAAKRHIDILRRFDFEDICVSLKASDVMTTIRAYELMAGECDYPLHVGVTEAGTEYEGVIASSVGIGALLARGIGDTIRVSLTAPPLREVKAGIAILRSLGLRRGGVKIISCPTCGRTQVDLIALAEKARERFGESDKNAAIAIMGCAVNGPGEARGADFGVACGKGEGLLFKKGEIVGKVPFDEILDRLEEFLENYNE